MGGLGGGGRGVGEEVAEVDVEFLVEGCGDFGGDFLLAGEDGGGEFFVAEGREEVVNGHQGLVHTEFEGGQGGGPGDGVVDVLVGFDDFGQGP